MRFLVILVGILVCTLSSQASDKVTSAHIYAMFSQFKDNYMSLQSTLATLEETSIRQQQSLQNLQKKVSKLEVKANAPVDKTEYATKQEINELRSEIRRLSSDWEKQHIEMQNQLNSSLERIESLIKGINIEPMIPDGPFVETPKYKGLASWEVRSGDNYSKIAREVNGIYKINVSPEDIKKANPNVDPRKLTIGQEIYFPVPDNIDLGN